MIVYISRENDTVRLRLSLFNTSVMVSGLLIFILLLSNIVPLQTLLYMCTCGGAKIILTNI